MFLSEELAALVSFCYEWLHTVMSCQLHNSLVQLLQVNISNDSFGEELAILQHAPVPGLMIAVSTVSSVLLASPDSGSLCLLVVSLLKTLNIWCVLSVEAYAWVCYL